jgi:hypothetical protein
MAGKEEWSSLQRYADNGCSNVLFNDGIDGWVEGSLLPELTRGAFKVCGV